MYFVDTHSHLFWEHFEDDLQQVVQRAKDAGIEKIVVPNVDLDTYEAMINLVDRYKQMMYPALGLHPSSAKEDYQTVLDKLFSFFPIHDFCAIGEIGLDYYWDKTFVEQQKEAFRWQVRFAKEHNLPVIIHTRDSFDDVMEIVEDEKTENLRGVFHCFTGTQEEAERILNLDGFYLGIGGVLTFKNSKLANVVKEIPLERLVLETDSPFLTPHPYRGKRNESAYLVLVARKLAEVKNVDLETIARVTTENAESLFGI